MPSRRALLSRSLAAAVLGATGLPKLACAGSYPDRPITIIVGFPPGGGVDGPLRHVAEKLGRIMGGSVVVQNMPGANQIVAIRKLMSSRADGYTLLAGTGSSLAQNSALNPAVGYNPLTDFTLIGRYAASPGVLVVPSVSPLRTFEDFVAYARANPGKLRYASAGVGSTSHLGIEVLSRQLGISMLHVPYRGDAPAVADTAEVRVDVGLNVSTTLIPYLSTGKLRLLATTSPASLPFAPGLRSLTALAGPGMAVLDPYTFFGLVGPRDLPPAIVEVLSSALQQAARSPEFEKSMREVMYAEPISETPAQFRAFVQKQMAQWKPYAGKLEIASS